MHNKENNVSDVSCAMKAVADNINLARTSRSLKQAEVASACNISVGTYQAVEKGSLSPSMRAYVNVLYYFGLAGSLSFLGASHFDKVGIELRSLNRSKRISH